MGNFSGLQARFFRADGTQLYNNNGVLSTTTGQYVFFPVRAKSQTYWKKVGYGQFYAPIYGLLSPPIVAIGHYAIVYVNDAIAGKNIAVCPPFRIDTIQIDYEGSNNTPMYEISGPTMEHEFGEWLLWFDVGLQEGGFTTSVTNQDVNETQIAITDSTNFDDGDTIKLHRSALTNWYYRGTQVGAPYSDPPYTLIDIDPPVYCNDGGAGIVAGDYVIATDYANPATDDIDQMINEMKVNLLWTLEVYDGGGLTADEGTLAGTAHAAVGQSVFDGLNAAASITGEWWRLKQRADVANGMNRVLEWRRASDSSGIRLVMPEQADAATDYANAARGIIEGFTQEYEDSRVSHLIATCAGYGDKKVTLSDATDTPSAGFTLATDNEASTSTLIIDSVKDALDDDGVFAYRYQAVNFSDINPAGPSDEARETAANQLLKAAENYLTAYEEELSFYRVTAVVHENLEIGQTIELYYTNSEFTIDATGANALYILEMSVSIDTEGIPRYDLLLGETLQGRMSGLDKVVAGIGTTNATVGVLNANSGGTGSGGSTGGNHNPVTVTSSTPASALTLSGQALTFTDTDIDGSDPGTLTAATTNITSAGVHYHAITNTADGETNPSTILSSSANGGLRLDRFGVNTPEPASSIMALNGDLSFIGAQTISTTVDDLSISPAGNLILTPAGEFVTLGAGAVDPTIKTDHWTSGFLGTGWSISHDGHLDARSIYADELHVTHFTAEHLRVKSGGEWITPSTSTLTADMVVPAVSGTTTIYVDDVPGLQGMPVFADEDYVLLRVFDNTAGALNIFNVWGQVETYVDQADGTQAWTFTTRSASATGDTIQQGSTVVDFGQPGDGGIFLNAVDEAGAPYIDMFRWYDNPYTAGNRIHPIRLGDLGGTGVEEKGVMGLFIGDTTGKYLVFSERKAEMHGIGLSLYDHDNTTGYIRFDYFRIAVDYGSGTSTTDPNADIVGAVGDFATSNIDTSSGSTYYNLVDNATSPDGNWVGNETGENARLIMDLDNMTSSFTNTESIKILSYIQGISTSANIRVMVDVLDNAGERITTLGELANQDSSTGAVSVELRPLKVLTESDWDSAIINIYWIITPTGLTTKVIELDPTTPKIAIYPDTSISYYDQRQAYSFEHSGGSLLGGVFSSVSATTAYTGLESYVPSAGLQATAYLRSVAGSGDKAVTYIAASGNAGVEVAEIIMQSDNGAGDREISTVSDVFELLADDIELTGNVVIDQGGSDTAILQCVSGDVTGMVAQGMSGANTYFEVAKANATQGGALLRGGGESNHGIWLVGSAYTADSTESSAARAPVMITGRGNNTTVGASNNVVVWQNYTTGLMILKGDGELHNTYSTAMTNNFDEYEDIHLVRALANSIGDTIQSKWDQFVNYNADDLDRLGILQKNGFGSMQKLTMLQIGTLWQLHERIAALEERLDG